MRTFASCRDLIGRKFGLDQELDVMIGALTTLDDNIDAVRQGIAELVAASVKQ